VINDIGDTYSVKWYTFNKTGEFFTLDFDEPDEKLDVSFYDSDYGIDDWIGSSSTG
jgi:hypothetical protein